MIWLFSSGYMSVKNGKTALNVSQKPLSVNRYPGNTLPLKGL